MSKRKFPSLTFSSTSNQFKKPRSNVNSGNNGNDTNNTASSSTSTVYTAPGSYKEVEESWGDDVDDEVLLIASQAFEEVDVRDSRQSFNARVHSRTSEIISIASDPNPNEVEPASQCNDGPSPPAYGSSISNMASNEHIQNLIRQMNLVKKENDRLKTETDRYIEQCLTKDGEVSILRTQLKCAQAQVASVKREKLQNHEKSQIEWLDKFKTVSGELQSYKSQMEFKTLEIANLKEKCKILETGKIKFVEAPSHNESLKWPTFNLNSSRIDQKITVATSEMATQSNSKSMKLFIPKNTCFPLKECIHESFFDNSSVEIPIIFNSNKQSSSIENCDFSHTRKKILADCSNDNQSIRNNSSLENMKLESIYGEVSKLRAISLEEILSGDDFLPSAFKVLIVSKLYLIRTLKKLEALERKLTLLNIREMDENYIKFSGKKLDMFTDKSVFDGRCWFENEQGVDVKRLLGVAAALCQYIKPVVKYVVGSRDQCHWTNTIKDLEKKFQLKYEQSLNCNFLELLSKICKIIGNIGCSHLYAGFLTSTCLLLDACKEKQVENNEINKRIFKILHEILLLRPHAKILKIVCSVLKDMSLNKELVEAFCNNSNFMLDFNEGVALYDRTTCSIQLLCNNIEVWTMRCVNLKDIPEIFTITNELLELFQNSRQSNATWAMFNTQKKCLCCTRINRCLCICLHKCVSLYKCNFKLFKDENLIRMMNSTLAKGIVLLHFCVLNDIEFISRLGDNEGHFQIFIRTCYKIADQLQLEEIYRNILTELFETIFVVSENSQDSCNEAIENWNKCFGNFSLTD